MKIEANKLRAAMKASETSIEDLAGAIRPGGGRKAMVEAGRSVRSWLRGSDHPRCKAVEVEAMAGVLGVQPSEIASYRSVARFVRSSPSKSRLVADLIRGRHVGEAMDLLDFSPKRAAVFVRKTLNAAISDAEAGGAPLERLVVSESFVDEGPIIKRFQPKDRGRAHPIQKKTSHITVAVSVTNEAEVA